MKQTLVLVRGLPGSGKSTLAKKIAPSAHYEADQFRYRNGVYVFDPSETGEVHQKCYDATRDAITRGERIVAVSNTFVKLWEYQKYEELAKEFGVGLVIIKCVGRFNNLHGVDDNTIARMRTNWQVDDREVVLASSRKRVVNEVSHQCSAPDCDELLTPKQGFYLGKRGRNGEDYYLCRVCDFLRRVNDAKRKENRKAIEEHQTTLANKRAERLHKKTEGGSCDCIE